MALTVSPAAKAVPCMFSLGYRPNFRQPKKKKRKDDNNKIWDSKPSCHNRSRRLCHGPGSNADLESEAEPESAELDFSVLESKKFLPSLATCDSVSDVVHAIDAVIRTSGIDSMGVLSLCLAKGKKGGSDALQVVD